MTDRETKQQLYIRICQDSLFKLDYINAAILTGKILGCSPIEIWMAFSNLQQMEDIAKGEHPAAKRPVTVKD